MIFPHPHRSRRQGAIPMSLGGRLLLSTAILALAVLGAGAIPWKSRTVIDIRVVDESGRPLAYVPGLFYNSAGKVIAEGMTDSDGTFLLKQAPSPETDWGKHIWRLEFFPDGYVTNESPINITESVQGSVLAWIPPLRPDDHTPYLQLRVKSLIVCRKIG